MGNFFESMSSCIAPTTDNVVTMGCILIVLKNVVTALVSFAGIVALVMFIIGGYRFINSGGDSNKIDAAKKNFTYGMLGLTVVLLSFAIIALLSYTTGLECIKSFGFNCTN